ncbi:MAG: hypothetical protein QOD77_167 [Thermoplasmata archaeon]|nr:hypothetical protein [Thermoplasmata archaeon]
MVASRCVAVLLALAVATLLVPPATAPLPPGCSLGTFVEVATPADGSTVSGPASVAGTSALCGDANNDGFVVVAVTDTGINPYNPDFGRVPGQPTGHPSSYVDAFPSGMATLTPSCTATSGIVAACASDFAGVATGTPYWIEGTKVIAAISFDPYGAVPILDENGHGTASASVAIGNTNGLCPACLLVVVEGLLDEGVAWAASQPYVDIITNSWVSAAAGLATNVGGAEIPETKALVEEGGSVLFAAGNGHENMFITPMQTYESGYTGVDWHMVVGAVFPGDTSVLGSGKPVHVSSYGAAVPSACHDDASSSCFHSGTSAATPQVAGALGHVLTKAKRLLDSKHEGPEGTVLIAGEPFGVAAKGDLVPGNQYLDDGLLTRQELWNLVLRTAAPLSATPDPLYSPPSIGLPASPVDHGYAGYGVVNQASRDDAIDRLAAGSDLPDTTDVDDFIRQDSEVRVAYWGPWAESKMGTNIGAAGVPPGGPPLPPALKLKVNGLPAGTTTPDAMGGWDLPVDFGAFPAVAGAYVVRAEYAGVSDVVTYLAPTGGGGGGGASPTPDEPAATTATTPPADLDGDGHPDGLDDCPSVVDPDQSDLDRDGAGDACDDDRDGDTIGNAMDRCPSAPDRSQADLDGDGKGDACDDDLDGDGVRNAADNCPSDRNADQRNSDGDPPGDACEAAFGPPQDSGIPLGAPAEARAAEARAADAAPAKAANLEFVLAMGLIAGVLTCALLAVLVAARRRKRDE